MTKTHDLFKDEIDILERARSILKDERYRESGLYEEFIALLKVYEKNLKSMIKMTNISDSQQNYLQEIQADLKKEIEERKRAEEKLEHYAFHDLLTGIANRRNGLMVLRKEIIACLRHKLPLTICFIDIDGLKKVNDTYGHFEGDYLIITIAQIINSSIRETDTVSRFGGDEFLLILPDCNLKNSKSLIERIYCKMQQHDKEINKPYGLSFSCGIEEVDYSNADNVNYIIKRADEKMFMEKIKKKVSDPRFL